ncbi:MAG: hypothetical protein AAGE98_10145 [Actinomycetota bacterium]
MSEPPSRLTRLGDGLRRLAFVYLVALVAAVVSERMFWFWSPGLRAHLEVAAFYAIAAGPLVWAIARYRVNSWWSLMLALPLFSLVVEGIITPVVYSGGPFVPIFPAWFAFWHGVLGAGLFVFGIRWMLVEGRTRLLLVTSVGAGLFWALWSTTLWLPENLEDPELIEDSGGPLQLLDPSEFAVYAATFTAVTIVGHVLLHRIWPRTFEPSRTTVRVGGGVLVLWAAAWTIAIPWALPMFVAYAWLQRWGLRRHERTATGPGLLARLAGPVRPIHFLALMPMAPVAAGTYAVLWNLDLPLDVPRTFMWSMIAVQTLAGGVLMVRSLRRSGRPDDASSAENDDTPEPVGPGVS